MASEVGWDDNQHGFQRSIYLLAGMQRNHRLTTSMPIQLIGSWKWVLCLWVCISKEIYSVLGTVGTLACLCYAIVWRLFASCSSLISVAVTNTMTKSIAGKENIYFILHWWEVGAERWRQDYLLFHTVWLLTQELPHSYRTADSMEEYLLMAFSQVYA